MSCCPRRRQSIEDAAARRTRAAFREWRGPEAEAQRAAEIAALPVGEWKGQKVWTIRCQATSGNGPHDLNVPEALLWALMDLGRYRCPYHS